VVNGAAQTIPVNSGWVFVGPTTLVTLKASQTVSGAVSASLGVTAGSTALVDVDFCYTTSGQPTPVPFYGYAWVTTELRGPMQLISDTATMAPLDDNGGTYTVGLCAQNESATVPIDQNDYVTGWLQIAEGRILTN
jgi:hypothetical protein